MSKDYGSIPSSSGGASTDDDSGSSKRNGIVAVIGVLVAGIVVAGKIFSTNDYGSIDNSIVSHHNVETEPAETTPAAPVPEWPPMMMRVSGIPLEEFPNKTPTNTEQAIAMNWVKAADEPCNSYLGEPWLYGGKRSIDTSATLYFTPQVGSIPGVVSGIEVDYYGYYEESMLGTYFSEERTSDDGTYHSVSLALRDYDKHDLCDASSPLSNTGIERITVAPVMASDNVPITEKDPELKANWSEGSCIAFMGNHWSKDVVGGPNMTYKAENLMPVTPMYNSDTGELAAVYFSSTELKQNWPFECKFERNPAQPCAAATGKLNFWDRGFLPEGKRGMCGNFCDAECNFTGTKGGMFNTMHFMLMDTFVESCNGHGLKAPFYCKTE